MSSSDRAKATLHVRSASGLDELVVVDSEFWPVASGTGALTVSLAPGIYEVVARAGPTVRRRLIKLVAGERRDEAAPEVLFPASAPIRGTLMEDADQLALVRGATEAVADRAGVAAALCVVLRDAGEAGQRRNDPPPVDLLDVTLRPVDVFSSSWRLDDRGRAAISVGTPAPGGYVLRLGQDFETVDQSLWLPTDWTTVVFVTVDARGIQPASASVHMMPLGEAWLGGRDAAATELALWGLREGRWQAGEAATEGIRAAAAGADPILRIAATHLLLEAPRVDGPTVASIVDGLARSLPDHPDVVALQLVAMERGVRLSSRPALPRPWPPMLLASYRALLRRDAVSADAFVRGSIAERAAAAVMVRSIWTTWRPISPSDRIPPRLARTTVRAERVLDKVARNPAKVRRPNVSDPATRRVAAFLTAVADLDSGSYRPRVADLSPTEIALATGLPMATVDRSLRALWLSFAGLAVLPLVVTLTALVGLLAVASGGLMLLGPGIAPPPTTPLVTPTPTPSSTPPPSSTPTPTRVPSVAPPLPGVELPPVLELPATPVGEPTRTQLPIPNVGDAPLSILEFSLSGEAAGDFTLDEGECRHGPIAPGDSCTVLVVFRPAVSGDRRAGLSIHTAELGAVTVALAGIGRPTLSIEPPAVTKLAPGRPQSVFVWATGPITIQSVRLGGGDPNDFQLETDCEGALLTPERGCQISVTYTPRGEGEHAAEIQIVTDDGSVWTVPVDGVNVIF